MTAIASLLSPYPRLHPIGPPEGHCPHDHLFAQRDREFIYQVTGKLIATVATVKPLLLDAGPDRTVAASEGLAVRETAIAKQILGTQFVDPHQRTSIDAGYPR
jgi:hypothetical protein